MLIQIDFIISEMLTYQHSDMKQNFLALHL